MEDREMQERVHEAEGGDPVVENAPVEQPTTPEPEQGPQPEPAHAPNHGVAEPQPDTEGDK